MNVWLLHGILAFVAWGVLSPAATVTSILYRMIRLRNHRDSDNVGDDDCGGRSNVGDATTSSSSTDNNNNNNSSSSSSSNGISSKKTFNTLWIRIHRYMHETVVLLTWIVFFIAVGNTRPGHHFTSSSSSSSSTTQLPKLPHKIVGLIIFISTFVLWGLGRVVMPPKNKTKTKTKKESKTKYSDPGQEGSKDQEEIVAARETTALIVDDVEVQQQQRQQQQQSQKTTSSESNYLFVCSSAVHRLLGYVVSIVALWEIWSGMVLFFHHESKSKSESESESEFKTKLDEIDNSSTANDDGHNNEGYTYIRWLFSIWCCGLLLVLIVMVVVTAMSGLKRTTINNNS